MNARAAMRSAWRPLTRSTMNRTTPNIAANIATARNISPNFSTVDMPVTTSRLEGCD
jgi:hypothetical protein